MSIVLTRVDNRLLHGIVATQWAPASGADRMMVIDDTTANDPILKEGMKLGKPAGMSLSIISLETALENFATGKYDKQKVFIVVKEPESILRLIETGQTIKKLNIGGTISYEDGIKLSARAMARMQDMNTYKKLAQHGVKLSVQYIPSDKEIPLQNLIALD